MDSSSWSSGSMPASSTTARTTAARSARWPARVLPVHLRETRTRRPPRPRFGPLVGLVLAVSGDHAGLGVLRLDAVAQPVGSRRRTGQPPHLLGQAVDVRFPGREESLSS